jgi:nickel-dependent lactate racemase
MEAPAGPARAKSEEEIVRAAMESPIGSPRLFELARGAKSVVIITSDHTRPVPSRLTIPVMLEEIRRGAPEARVAILVATGCHRGSTREEIEKKFGRGVADNELVTNHDPHDSQNMAPLGRLPSGGELSVSRLALECDLLCADGFIEPHQFAGFSGGRKSVLPGIASFQSVLDSHNAEFTVHPKAVPGSLDGNPFQEDMLFAARRANLRFILNVTLTPAKRVREAFAGDMEKAHLAGCQRVLEECSVAAKPAPVVVASNGGYPLDQNIYQSTKSIMAADLVCADGGVIVSVNECRDGHGSESFLESFQKAPSLDALLQEIEGRGRGGTIPDQWVIQLTASILRRRRVIMVTKAAASEVEALGMAKAGSLSEALEMADRLAGPMSPIIALPEAVGVVIKRL